MAPAPDDQMPLGIVVERRDVDHAWQDHEWRAIAVLPGAPALSAPELLEETGDTKRYHASTLRLELYKGETEGYRANLSSQSVVYVVLRESDDDSAVAGAEPFLATVCPYEAQDYMDSGEDQVDAVPLPPDMASWIATFVNRHHVDQPFKKRKRDQKPGDMS